MIKNILFMAPPFYILNWAILLSEKKIRLRRGKSDFLSKNWENRNDFSENGLRKRRKGSENMARERTFPAPSRISDWITWTGPDFNTFLKMKKRPEIFSQRSIARCRNRDVLKIIISKSVFSRLRSLTSWRSLWISESIALFDDSVFNITSPPNLGSVSVQILFLSYSVSQLECPVRTSKALYLGDCKIPNHLIITWK